MHQFTKALLVAAIVVLPALAHAQALTGTVRDASGAVLPGVTVEAASPALLEKVRTAVTDGTGLYRLENLVPGTYTVTFALSGFVTTRREGVAVSSGQSITISADLRVGGVQETITVTGETPVVDVQTSTRTQKIIDNEVIAVLPASRGYGNILATVPGIQATGLNSGANPVMNFFTARGGRGNEGTIQIDGMNVGSAFNGGGVAGFGYDTANATEIQVTIAGGLGETDRGGPAFNMIPRTGGNNFSGTYFMSYAGEWAQASNLDAELISYGINEVPGLIKNWDTNFALGGPIKRDRLWFFGNVRSFGSANDVPGLYGNANAGNPNAFTYAEDRSIKARNANSKLIGAIRLTGQATPKNKLSFYYDYQKNCSGSAFTEDGEQCRAARRRLGRARSHRRLRLELTRGRQPGVGRPREDRPGHVDVHGHQQAAHRSRSLVLQQPLEPVSRRRRGPEHRLDHRTDRLARERHSGAVLHLPLDRESARQRSAAQRVARVDVVRDRLAQHEGRISGGLPGAEAVHDRQPEHDQLHVLRRGAVDDHAVHPEPVQQPHAFDALYLQDQWTVNRFTVSGRAPI